jgi:hypothetical protein
MCVILNFRRNFKMMMMGALTGMLGGAGATAGATAGAAATTASTGLSISSILQGVATVGGVVASIAAGNAEASNLKMQARDAEEEKTVEVLQSVDRKRSLLKSAQEAVGEIDAAYSASGVDLSFGSAAQAKKDVFRETDLSLNSESATTGSRLSRLTDRAQNYYRMAKGAKRMGLIGGLTRGLSGFAEIADRRM